MLAQRIKQLRKEKKLTQSQLAKLLFIDQSAVSYWEQGESNPDIEKQIALAKIFGVTVDYLLGLSDVKIQEPPPEISTEEALRIAFKNEFGREPNENDLKKMLGIARLTFEA